MVDVEVLHDNDLICYCIEVDKGTIVKAIQNGNDSLKKIKESTRACTGSECKTKNPQKRCCSIEIKKLIELYTEKNDTTYCSCCSNEKEI